MNTDLIIKFKKEFDWWLANPDKAVMIKAVNGWERCLVRNPWITPPELAESIKAIVINDEYVKFRMAFADGKEVTRRGHVMELPLFDCPPDEYDIKPSWKWQDEISKEKPVICKVYGDYGCIGAVDSVKDGKYTFLLKNQREIVYCPEPITVADLHDFQRKGYYNIDELCDIHDKEFYPHKGATSAVGFLDWLRKKAE
jgi:hypothetical protein